MKPATLTRGLVLAVVFWTLLALAIDALAGGERTPLSCDRAKVGVHVKRAKAFIARAHNPRRLLDPSPAKPAERRRWRAERRCVLDRGLKRVIDRFVDRRRERFNRTFRELITPPGHALLVARRSCESGSSGLYRADTGNGYAGAYQFSATSWALTAEPFRRATGLTPNPSRTAAPREQDIRAAILDRTQAGDPWPNCP